MPSLSSRYQKHKTLRAFGRAVRRLRSARGLSQEQLALVADIDRSYVGGIERGESNVTLMNIARIAAVLKVSVSELMAEAKL